MKRLITAALPIGIIGIAALLLWSGLTVGHDWGDDFAVYIMQARSITEGRPLDYVRANRVTAEQSSSTYVVPVANPWGFPLLLAPVYALYGLNMIALKSVPGACFLLFLVVLWIGFRRRHLVFWLAVLMCLFALNPTMLGFTDKVLSDIPFLLVSTIGVLFVGKLVVERRRLISPIWDQVALGVVFAAAFFIRTNGILLVATLAATQVIAWIWEVSDGASHHPPSADFTRRLPARYRAVGPVLFHALPYAACAIVVLAWQAIFPDGGLSQRSVLGLISRDTIRSNVYFYPDATAGFFDGAPFGRLIFGATIPLAVAGASARYRSDYHMIVYAALTVGLYIVWPPTDPLRFLLPALPFYFSFALSSLERRDSGLPRPVAMARSAIGMVAVVLILVCFGKQSTRDVMANLARGRATPEGPFDETSSGMFSYIRDNTPPDSVVVFFKPRAMRLMTGRLSIKINKVAELSRGDYVSLYRPDKPFDQILPDEVQCLTRERAIQPIYTNTDFVVYRVTWPHDNSSRTNGRCESLSP